jgi:hypothetical protein
LAKNKVVQIVEIKLSLGDAVSQSHSKMVKNFIIDGGIYLLGHLKCSMRVLIDVNNF